MYIKSMHISSFGGLRSRDIVFSDGVNVLGGANESGKTSAAMFIKFIFYGLSARNVKSAGASERVRYVNRDTMQASGYLNLLTHDGREYRIERTLSLSDSSPARESVRITDLADGRVIPSQEPGVYFFGVSEEIFTGTAFVSQSAEMKPSVTGLDHAANSADTRSSAQSSANIISSGSEDIDLAKSIKYLEGLRRGICHKNGGGGELNELKEKRAALAEELKESEKKAAEILSLSASLESIKKHISELERDDEEYSRLFSSLDKIVLKRRMDALAQTREKRDKAEEQISRLEECPLGESALRSLSEAENDIRAYDELVLSLDGGDSDTLPPADNEKGSEGSGGDIDFDGVLSAVSSGELDFDGVDGTDNESGGSEDSDGGHVDYALPESGIGDRHEPSPMSESAERDIDEVSRLWNDSRTKIAVAFALLIAGVIGLGAFAVLYIFNTDLYSIPLIMTVAFVILGIVFMCMHISSKKKLNALLDKWEAESADDFEDAVARKLAAMRKNDAEEKNRELVLAKLSEAKGKFDAAETYVRSLMDEVGLPDSGSIYTTIDELKKAAEEIAAKKKELEAASGKLEGRLDLLSELVAGADEHEVSDEVNEILATKTGKFAASLDADGVKKYTEKRDFTREALKTSQKRKSSLEEKLAELGKLSHFPDEYRSMINSLDEKIAEYSLRYEACEAALAAVKKAGESMRGGMASRLTGTASELMYASCGHGRVVFDEYLTPSLTDGGCVKSGEILSRGTADLTYLSLRVSLMNELFPTERPPMILDESFAHVDEKRMRGFFGALESAVGSGQYIILTCRGDEMRIADECGMKTVEM